MSSKNFENYAKSKMQITRVSICWSLFKKWLIIAQSYEWEKLEWVNILQAWFRCYVNCFHRKWICVYSAQLSDFVCSCIFRSLIFNGFMCFVVWVWHHVFQLSVTSMWKWPEKLDLHVCMQSSCVSESVMYWLVPHSLLQQQAVKLLTLSFILSIIHFFIYSGSFWVG